MGWDKRMTEVHRTIHFPTYDKDKHLSELRLRVLAMTKSALIVFLAYEKDIILYVSSLVRAKFTQITKVNITFRKS